jgi:hypothetical protein
MKLSALPIAACFSALALLAPVTVHAQDEPAPTALERYVLGVGQNSDGTASAINDRYFGNGTARATVAFFDPSRRYNPTDTVGTLVLNVSRYVRPDEIVFALLCFGVQVRGYDEAGALVHTEDLPGFTFGDSKSGRYTKALRNLPLSVSRWEITFLGNYE